MDYTFPEKFHRAAELFDLIIGDLEKTSQLDNEHKLLFYALRQQAEKGPCTDPAPSLWRFVERHKHGAWCKLGSMSSFEAMVHFVRFAESSLFPDDANVNWRAKYHAMIGEGSSVHGTADTTHLASSMEIVSTELFADHTLWDDDLRTHCAPTEENVVYLASQAMHARRKYEALVGEMADASSTGVYIGDGTGASHPATVTARTQGCAASSASPPSGVKAPRHGSASITVAPPGIVTTTSEPPTSAQGFTQASSDEEGSLSPPPPETKTWMDWFGW